MVDGSYLLLIQPPRSPPTAPPSPPRPGKNQKVHNNIAQWYGSLNIIFQRQYFIYKVSMEYIQMHKLKQVITQK